MSHPKYSQYKSLLASAGCDFPSHWSAIKLSALAAKEDYAFADGPFGSDLKNEEYTEEGVPLVQLNNIGIGTHRLEALKYISEEKADQLRKHNVFPGDIVIAKMAEPVARASIVRGNFPRYVIVADCIRLKTNHELINNRFAEYAINSPYFRTAAELVSRGTGRIRINLSSLKALQLGVPTPKEQQAIASFLDRETAKIDALIAEQKRLIELLQEKRQAVISHAVTKGLNPNAPMKDSGVEWLGEVPEHWDISRLGHFAAIENGSTPPRNNPEYWEEGTIPWLGSTEVNQGRVATYSEKVTEQALLDCPIRRLPAKTVLIGMIGQGRTRGMAAILELDAAISQNIAAVVPGKRLDPEYLLNFLRASYEWIRSTARGGNQAALNCQIIGELRICLPPLSEQAEISSRISEEMHGLEKLQNKALELIKLLDERRSALISAAVTGQIDVRGLISTENEE